jgi:small subunit ribosomal protein S17
MTTETQQAAPSGAATSGQASDRTARQRLVGKVISTKMQTTVVVEVERTRRHPLYGKVIRVHKNYKAHDENNECKIGDHVRIVESRPYSKDKHYRVEEILNRAAQIDTAPLTASPDVEG